MSVTTHAITSPKGTIRVICFFKRRKDITEEEFYHHWEHVHGPLLAPWVIKNGIDSYTQVQTPHAHRTQWSALLSPPLPQPLTAIPHNGYALMDFSSPDKMRNAFLDPYYAETIVPDECNFLDKSEGEYGNEAMSTMGTVVKIVEGGVWVQAGSVETDSGGK